MNYYFLPEEFLTFLDFKYPNVANTIRYECIKFTQEEISSIRDSKSGIGRIISREVRYSVLVRQGWVCNQCGTKLKYSSESWWEGEIAHIDHIHPYSERFTYIKGSENINEPENLQALCPKCNLSKSNKDLQ